MPPTPTVPDHDRAWSDLRARAAAEALEFSGQRYRPGGDGERLQADVAALLETLGSE